MATRRSARVSTNAAKKEKEERLEARVKAGVADGLATINAGEMGRGVATLRKFDEGDFVCLYEGEVVPYKEAIRRYISSSLIYEHKSSKKKKLIWLCWFVIVVVVVIQRKGLRGSWPWQLPSFFSE